MDLSCDWCRSTDDVQSVSHDDQSVESDWLCAFCRDEKRSLAVMVQDLEEKYCDSKDSEGETP